jgi:trk system potassium uptake protein TrkH
VAFSFFRILSYLLGLVGFLMLLPVVVAMRYGEEPFIPAFLVPALIGLAAAAYFRLSSGKKKRFFNAADAVVTVGGIWVGVSLFGAIPLYFSGVFASFADALFESVSGFTTTGASIAPDVESLPRCVNFWRCQMHWMGGMGVIALAVAIMPLWATAAIAW